MHVQKTQMPHIQHLTQFSLRTSKEGRVTFTHTETENKPFTPSAITSKGQNWNTKSMSVRLQSLQSLWHTLLITLQGNLNDEYFLISRDEKEVKTGFSDCPAREVDLREKGQKWKYPGFPWGLQPLSPTVTLTLLHPSPCQSIICTRIY